MLTRICGLKFLVGAALNLNALPLHYLRLQKVIAVIVCIGGKSSAALGFPRLVGCLLMSARFLNLKGDGNFH